MKNKLLTIALALAMTLGLAACGGKESSPQPVIDKASLTDAMSSAMAAASEKAAASAASEAEPPAAPEADMPAAPEADMPAAPEASGPATVEIVEATDELLAQYAGYDEFDVATDDYGIKLLLTTDSPLSEVTLSRLTWDGAAQKQIVYQQEELTPARPLVIWVSFPGALPTIAFDFIDADGTTKNYYINMSGEDGSVLLTQAETITEGAAPEGDTTPATVEITEVTEEMLAQYSDYSAVDVSTDNYGIRVMLTTDRTVRELRLFSLVWDDGTQWLTEAPDGVLYRQEELTPDKPLVVYLSIPGTMPTVGLDFIDADGTTKSYHIVMSGEDGSMQLAQA